MVESFGILADFASFWRKLRDDEIRMKSGLLALSPENPCKINGFRPAAQNVQFGLKNAPWGDIGEMRRVRNNFIYSLFERHAENLNR